MAAYPVRAHIFLAYYANIGWSIRTSLSPLSLQALQGDLHFHEMADRDIVMPKTHVPSMGMNFLANMSPADVHAPTEAALPRPAAFQGDARSQPSGADRATSLSAPSSGAVVPGATSSGQQPTHRHGTRRNRQALTEQEGECRGDTVDQIDPNAALGYKPRLRWTPELHERFAQAVTDLGGPDVATPKQILHVMQVEGLTIFHIKVNLHEFRY